MISASGLLSVLAITTRMGRFLAALVILNLIGMTISAYIILKRKK